MVWLVGVVWCLCLAGAAGAPRGVSPLTRLRGGSDMEAMLDKLRHGEGFVAALDQSGGSTPKALADYGLGADAYSSEEEMFDLVHGMRERIVTRECFSGDKVIGAILFEQTMDRDFDGRPAPEYLWKAKGVVPLLKCDKGLAPECDGCQLMKEIDGLEATLARAKALGVAGTKMRSRIGAANEAGIRAVVAQQFDVARRIIACGLVPIVEPEVDIGMDDKGMAEELLLNALHEALHDLEPGQLVMLKLSLPDIDDLYASCVAHPNVVRVLALSGGYDRDTANAKLRTNAGVIGSFSRALMEGADARMTDADFDAHLAKSIDAIHDASLNKHHEDDAAEPALYNDFKKHLGKD